MKKALLTICIFITSSISSAKGFITHATITTYNAVAGQCDSTPHITADGTRIDHKALKEGRQRIVAVSRDLLAFLPYGSVVEIEGHGRYIVADTIHKRWTHRVDILQHHSEKGFKHENVKVKKLK